MCQYFRVLLDSQISYSIVLALLSDIRKGPPLSRMAPLKYLFSHYGQSDFRRCLQTFACKGFKHRVKHPATLIAVNRGSSQFLLNAEQLIVLGDPVGTTQ